MKASNREVYYPIYRLVVTLSTMSNEFEEMMRHYEAIIHYTGLDLAIETNQIKVFTDVKNKSEIVKNRLDQSIIVIDYDYMEFKQYEFTEKLSAGMAKLSEKLSEGRATFNSLFSDYTNLMDIIQGYLINLDNHTVTNEDLVRRAVHDILSTEITETILENKNFSYYKEKENLATAVSLMQRFNSLLRASRENIQARLTQIYKIREIEVSAENKDLK